MRDLRGTSLVLWQRVIQQEWITQFTLSASR